MKGWNQVSNEMFDDIKLHIKDMDVQLDDDKFEDIWINIVNYSERPSIKRRFFNISRFATIGAVVASLVFCSVILDNVFQHSRTINRYTTGSTYVVSHYNSTKLIYSSNVSDWDITMEPDLALKVSYIGESPINNVVVKVSTGVTLSEKNMNHGDVLKLLGKRSNFNGNVTITLHWNVKMNKEHGICEFKLS